MPRSKNTSNSKAETPAKPALERGKDLAASQLKQPRVPRTADELRELAAMRESEELKADARLFNEQLIELMAKHNVEIVPVVTITGGQIQSTLRILRASR